MSTNDSPSGLRLTDVSVRFAGLRALEDVSIDIPRHSITALVGPNGAGKSTLLNAVTGFVPMASGEVYIGEELISNYDTRKRAELGVVRSFQTTRLLEGESVEDNILLGRERFTRSTVFGQLARSRRYRREDELDRTVVRRISEILALSDYLERSVSDLSFGLRRLVAVALVLAAEPEVLLLDEPAAGLDAPSRQHLTDAILAAHSHTPVTVIVVEHDIQLVRVICPDALILDRGRVIAQGPTKEVLSSKIVRDAYFG